MNGIRSIFEKIFFYNHWTVAWRRVADGDADFPESGTEQTYRVVPCEKGFWQADPFLVSENGKTFLFTEYMPFHSKHAYIACQEFLGDGFGKAEIVLRENVHLSYPGVFKHNGSYYMIPEMLHAHEVCLYKATEFPFKWVKEKTLLHMDSVDSTVFSENGKLFLYDPDNKRDFCRKLYYADLNMESGTVSEPVLIREFPEKLGRPAGNVFCTDSGKQVRPAQDCRRCYGGSLEFRSFQITGEVLEEEVLSTFGPDNVHSDLKYRATGLHTWNRCGNLEVIDLFYKRSSVLKPLRAFVRKLKKGADRL